MAFRDFRAKSEAAQDLGPVLEVAKESTYIDGGCQLAGVLRFAESVRVDGQVEGEIDCRKTVIIGESGQVRAKVGCESIVVFGVLDGDVEAKRKVTLGKSARVSGEIQTVGIAIEEGAQFKGQIVIGSDESPRAAAPTTPIQTAPKLRSSSARKS